MFTFPESPNTLVEECTFSFTKWHFDEYGGIGLFEIAMATLHNAFGIHWFDHVLLSTCGSFKHHRSYLK